MKLEIKRLDKRDIPPPPARWNISHWDPLRRAILDTVGTDEAVSVEVDTLREMFRVQAVVNNWARARIGSRVWAFPKGYILHTRSERIDPDDKMGRRRIYIWTQEAPSDTKDTGK